LRPIFNGNVFYANDAFDGLRLMEQIKSGAVPAKAESVALPEEEEIPTGAEAKIALALAEEKSVGVPKVSSVRRDVEIPRPPFFGSRVVDDVRLEEVFQYVNDVALIRGQWRVVKGKTSEADYQTLLKEKIYPEYESLKKKVIAERLLEPKAVYGYFPCQSDGNDLIVYDPAKADVQNELVRFSFPRQRDDRFLCLSDYFASKESGTMDVVAFQLVTVGKKASEYAKQLYESNNYRDYLYFHGLSVESAEAMAELWHKRIRQELGIDGKDAKEIKRLFSQGYQGSRYSFGYPACPNLEDQAKLFTLLQPERIGVTLTEEFQMEPEQSTSAIIVHHPDAKYFNVK
jgi:5-methyltetrahydrofolate--homocysteine methyltransferase